MVALAAEGDDGVFFQLSGGDGKRLMLMLLKLGVVVGRVALGELEFLAVLVLEYEYGGRELDNGVTRRRLAYDERVVDYLKKGRLARAVGIEYGVALDHEVHLLCLVVYPYALHHLLRLGVFYGAKFHVSLLLARHGGAANCSGEEKCGNNLHLDVYG